MSIWCKVSSTCAAVHVLVTLTLLAGAVSSRLKVVHYGSTDTVYMQEVPFHSLMELEISVSGEWTLHIEARQDLGSSYITQYQELLNHRFYQFIYKSFLSKTCVPF